MRKSIALALIKLAHRVNPPKVTETSGIAIVGHDGRGSATSANATFHLIHDPVAAKNALTEYEAQMRAKRKATRWN